MKRGSELLPNSLLDFVLWNDADLFLKNISKELQDFILFTTL